MDRAVAAFERALRRLDDEPDEILIETGRIPCVTASELLRHEAKLRRARQPLEETRDGNDDPF